MSTKQDTTTQDIMPAMMRAKTAAAYLDMKTRTFRRIVSMDALPKPIKLTERIHRWRKSDLDEWMNGFDGAPYSTDEWSKALAA